MFARQPRDIVVAIACAGLLALGLTAAIPVPQAVAAPTLPAGFVLRDQPSGQAAYDLTDFAYLPDGSVLTTGKQGKVAWVPADGGAPVTLATLPVNSNHDIGLVGIEVAPDYATSKQIYLARSVPTTGTAFVLRAARWTVTGSPNPAGLAQEKTLAEVPGDDWVHGLSGLVAADDGTVWISIGDVATPLNADRKSLRAMDLNVLQGKILHVTRDGLGVPSNPFYNAASPSAARSLVFASGFRSPFRLSLDPSTGLPIVGDVGWNTWEEVDFVQPGQNYAWPCWEGNHRTPGFADMPECGGVLNTAPLWEYHHGSASDQGNSVTGGIVYSGTSYPSEYQGAYFFGDYVGKKLWTLRYDSTGRLVQTPQNPPLFAGIGGPVKFAAAPNGDIVYADIFSGQLRRLSYAQGNKAPIAKAVTSTDPDTLTVSFDGSGSIDYDGDSLTYQWDFGDGATGNGVTATHTYLAGTQVTARLTVTDSFGTSGSSDIIVAPSNHSPVLQLTTPGAATFAVNEPIDLSATATDAEDGDLAVTWTSSVLHCPDESTCHSHPGVGATGATFGVPFTDHQDSRMELTATVTDSVGVTAAATYVAQPRQRKLTLLSNVPASLQIPSEGGVSSSLVTEGATVDVVAAATAADGASAFSAWAGGPTARTRTVTVGASDLTLTAKYIGPIDLRYNAEPGLRQFLGTATAAEVVDGGVRYRAYQGGRLYWSEQTGVREVHGAILDRYLQLGGHRRFGPPRTDESVTPDGLGRYSHFVGTPATLDASVYWTPNTGAHGIWGAIRIRWSQLDWERGPLGYPLDDETVTPDGFGRYNHFSKAGSIYWTGGTGAQEVYGAIRQRWAALGWERSYLGYPTSGEFGIPGGRRNNLQFGFIEWYAGNGAVIDRHY